MTFLEREVTTAAFCWRVARRDGVVMGFTTHDRDLEVAGLVYRAAPGMAPSAVTLAGGFEAEALDVRGALSSGAITSADLMAGRWDGASVRLFMVDWEAPDGAQMALAEGVIGEVAMRGHGFEAELRGRAAALERAVVEQTSPECRAALGDARCQVDMALRTRLTRVTAVLDEERVEVAGAAGGNAYAYGRLRWMSGANSGLASALLRSDGPMIMLREPPPFAVAVGDLVEIAEGCDKRLESCVARFGNAANFRGEPHLPGIDLLTRYPGA